MELEGWTFEKAKRLDDISRERRLIRSDFPDNYPLCPYNGQIRAFDDFRYMDVLWRKDEIIFDIDLRGIVKTPYDDECFNYSFGHFIIRDGIGHIIRDDLNLNSPYTAAFFDGKFCYLYDKIGYYVPSK